MAGKLELVFFSSERSWWEEKEEKGEEEPSTNKTLYPICLILD